jgi:hypothetical protein
MLLRLNDLRSYTILAADGEIGQVFGFYFDQRSWTVRFMVVDGKDQLRRRLLVSPLVVTGIDPEEMTISLRLDRETLANSPDLGLEQPPTPEEEEQLLSYFQLPMYWAVDDESLGTGSLAALPMVDLAQEIADQLTPGEDEANRRLRSTREIQGYNLQARDGVAGSLADFIVNDEDWSILYLIVEASGIGTKYVLLSPQWIESVSWEENHLRVDLERQTIINSPELDPETQLDRNFETQLYDHYGKNKDWEERN